MGWDAVLDNIRCKVLNYTRSCVINCFFTDVYTGYIPNRQNIQMENIMGFPVIYSGNVWNIFCIYILFISIVTPVVLIHIKTK